jgi:hypothetical protein
MKIEKKMFWIFEWWCKTKKLGGAKCKKHRNLVKKLKFQGVQVHPLTTTQHRPWPYSCTYTVLVHRVVPIQVYPKKNRKYVWTSFCETCSYRILNWFWILNWFFKTEVHTYFFINISIVWYIALFYYSLIFYFFNTIY